MAAFTVAEYAEANMISTSTARNRLNALVSRGEAKVSHYVVIGQRSVSSSKGRGSVTSVRGNVYELIEKAQQVGTEK